MSQHSPDQAPQLAAPDPEAVPSPSPTVRESAAQLGLALLQAADVQWNQFGDSASRSAERFMRPYEEIADRIIAVGGLALRGAGVVAQFAREAYKDSQARLVELRSQRGLGAIAAAPETVTLGTFNAAYEAARPIARAVRGAHRAATQARSRN